MSLAVAAMPYFEGGGGGAMPLNDEADLEVLKCTGDGYDPEEDS